MHNIERLAMEIIHELVKLEVEKRRLEEEIKTLQDESMCLDATNEILREDCKALSHKLNAPRVVYKFFPQETKK